LSSLIFTAFALVHLSQNPPIGVPETRSAIHQHAQQNGFRRRDARPQSGLFARWNQSLKLAQTPTGFLELVGDDFPILHAPLILSVCSPASNGNVIETHKHGGDFKNW
jgi:hypothetical protein